MNPLRLLSSLTKTPAQQRYDAQVSEMFSDYNNRPSLNVFDEGMLEYIITNSARLSKEETINVGNILCDHVHELYRSRFAEIRRLMPGALVTIYDSLHEHFPNINDNEEASILESRLAPIVRQIVQEGEVVSHPEQ